LMYDDAHRRGVLRALEPERDNLAEHWRASATAALAAPVGMQEVAA
jgi:glutamate--cysteine ligase